VLGTTISPYLIFWQAAQEVEDIHASPTRRRHWLAANDAWLGDDGADGRSGGRNDRLVGRMKM
jgi:hypothetical protein